RGIARARNKHVELSARLAGPVVTGEFLDDAGWRRQALGDRRQGAGAHALGEHRRFPQRSRGIGRQSRTRGEGEQRPLDENASQHAWTVLLAGLCVANQSGPMQWSASSPTEKNALIFLKVVSSFSREGGAKPPMSTPHNRVIQVSHFGAPDGLAVVDA